MTMFGLTHRLLTAIGALALLALAEPAAAQVSNQTILNRLDHVTQAWSRKLGAGRFALVLDNQAVLDKETGLVWERTPDPRTDPVAIAAIRCTLRNVGGRKGWRLPTAEELLSLVDPTRSAPALPAGHPFTNLSPSTSYWTATGSPFNSISNLVVRIADGEATLESQTDDFLVWCVRGGASSVEPQ
jgi:Protein of unknown function (DUF1566)